MGVLKFCARPQITDIRRSDDLAGSLRVRAMNFARIPAHCQDQIVRNNVALQSITPNDAYIGSPKRNPPSYYSEILCVQ